MNVFVSETCFRQVFGGMKGSSARRVEDFNRLVARLRRARTREDLQAKGLGTKKYKSVGRDVYGVDLNNGLTAERVIFVFVEPGDERARDLFGRYALPGESETVLLCYCSEHDSQHRHAVQVARSQDGGQGAQVALSLPDAEAERVERASSLEAPWRAYGPGDLERYGMPRTPVLTQDKFRIVGDFLARPRPFLVTGAAGSGKTELGLRAMADFVRARSGPGAAAPRALYVTASPRLLAEVEGRCPDDVRPSCDFLTFDTLLRALSGRPDARFAGRALFASFAAALASRPAMGGPARGAMLRLLRERGEGAAYAEIYGVVAGGMGRGWDRLEDGRAPGPLLPEEEYLSLPDDMAGLSGADERRACWRLAEAYLGWAGASGRLSRNAAAVEACLRAKGGLFDLVVADEAQDLTEVQIELLRRRCAPGEAGGALFMTGDVNQVLAPTRFDARRLMRMGGAASVERLQGNFRNPREVCRLANAVGGLRAASRRLPARRGVEEAPEEAMNPAPGRAMWWVGRDEAALVRMADEAANVALVADARTAARLRRGEGGAAARGSVFSVEQVKGMEFDNVILYGVLAAEEAGLDALFEDGPKDASLRRPVNTLYVGVTRSCGSLLVAEPRFSAALGRLAGADEGFRRVLDLGEVAFDLDASAEGYLRAGRALKEQGAYSAAAANLERALAAPPARDGGLTADEAEQARRLLAACRVYEENDPESTPPARLAALLEEAGLPEEALPHARAALDARRAALLALAAERSLDGARLRPAARVAAFEDALARGGLDVAGLYGESPAYDALLDWYLGQRAEDLELYALEAEEHAAGALLALRRAAAALGR